MTVDWVLKNFCLVLVHLTTSNVTSLFSLSLMFLRHRYFLCAHSLNNQNSTLLLVVVSLFVLSWAFGLGDITPCTVVDVFFSSQSDHRARELTECSKLTCIAKECSRWLLGAVVSQIDDQCRQLSGIVGVLVRSKASLEGKNRPNTTYPKVLASTIIGV